MLGVGRVEKIVDKRLEQLRVITDHLNIFLQPDTVRLVNRIDYKLSVTDDGIGRRCYLAGYVLHYVVLLTVDHLGMFIGVDNILMNLAQRITLGCN